MSRPALRSGGPSPADFRSPIQPDDRVLVLETLLDAKGNALPKPPVCHGYVNCCTCPPCTLRANRGRRRIAA
jgi:hypothetical protein